MTHVLKSWLPACLMALWSANALSQEVITLEGATIRGAQEAPLVLYLVPWKPPEAKSLGRQDEQLMLARPFKPLERAEFRRLMSYHQHFQALNGPPAGSGNADAGEK